VVIQVDATKLNSVMMNDDDDQCNGFHHICAIDSDMEDSVWQLIRYTKV